MGPLTQRAEKALWESIESWAQTAAQTAPTLRGAESCALCRAYPTTECRVSDTDREQCPISALGYFQCIGTPYRAFAASGTKTTAQAELDFLRAMLAGIAKARGETDE